MHGVYVRGERPKTKKSLREALDAEPDRVHIEATSVFGNEYDGPASGLPDGATVYIVGPDPFRSRNWYANLSRGKDGRLVLR
jgi:hypothetical protein